MLDKKSIDALVREAIAECVQHAAAAVVQHITQLAVQSIAVEVRGLAGGNVARVMSRGPARAARGKGKRRAGEITRWAADKRARRVPNFVIAMTGGLDTKQKILAKFGANAVFEQGKPLPKAA